MNGWMDGCRAPACCPKNIKIKIYQTTILRDVLYGCETWFLAMKEKHRLELFENRVLRKVFEPRRDVVSGDWIKLHNNPHQILC